MNQENLEFELLLNLSQNLIARQLLKNPLLQKDVWRTQEDLGLKVNGHRQQLTINFTEISPDWFKLLTKLYTLVRSKPGKPAQTVVNEINRLKNFSRRLSTLPIYSPDAIDDSVFDDFEYWLQTKKLKESSIQGYYKALSNFFNICRLEGWLDVNTYWFKGKFKTICPKNDEIEYIPEEVWNQIDRNLYILPEPLQRMILLIRTLGLRAGELLNLSFNCLRQRNGEWYIRLETEKIGEEDELLICEPPLVAVIKQQQNYIINYFGNSYNQLFCASQRLGFDQKRIKALVFIPQPKTMSLCSFNKWLNRFANKCNICTKDGNIWHFTSHQFRRTVATVSSNAGVDPLVIQHTLRHRTPEMLKHYVSRNKKVLSAELEELMKERKYVNVEGKIVDVYKPKNPVEELIRRKMYQVTTQYGECHRSVIQAPCQTVNACWRCEHWRTTDENLPDLKQDLERIKKELKIVKREGLIKLEQGLKGDHNNLKNCIDALEKVSD
ncbi:tyrosine-type recombinase/integrase [Nostoc commune]|uniref:tyrosine-type recombinase/integrase n=1 Tax=Nostoc commune TaxID=1178 RepID=UPI0018C6B275|nr:tyrosine-type recombinase/integrase [Nostoc commune]MBG1261125.1 site-specific integrase [Nostoc commune BAE]